MWISRRTGRVSTTLRGHPWMMLLTGIVLLMVGCTFIGGSPDPSIDLARAIGLVTGGIVAFVAGGYLCCTAVRQLWRALRTLFS